MRAFAIIIASLSLHGAAAAQTNPDNQCATAAHSTGAKCEPFFEKMKLVRATLAASKAAPEDVCEKLLEDDQLATAEYSDCYRFLHATDAEAKSLASK